MPPADEFDERASHWHDDLVTTLSGLYPDPQAVAARLIDVARAAYDERSADLRALDWARLAEPDWFQRSDMLGYAAYADRFAGDLRGVAKHSGHLADLGVTYLHLMPLRDKKVAPRNSKPGVIVFSDRRAELRKA